MVKIIIIVVLLIIVGIIAYNAYSKKNLPERGTVISNSDDVSEAKTNNAIELNSTKPCALTVILQIIGIINAFGGFILGLICGDEFGILIAIAVVFSGLMGCLFCFAFAKCVDAADKYLKSLRK